MPAITRAQSVLEVDQRDLRAINKELSNALNRISSFKKRREIVAPAAPLIIAAVKSETPVKTPIKRRADLKRKSPPERLRPDRTYRYKTPKVTSALRAGPGYGVVATEYELGNLRASIVDIADVKKKIRTYRVIIGPIYRRSRAKKVTLKKADGYYAHMVLGSALAFRKQIAEKGFAKVSGQVQSIVFRNLILHFKEEARMSRYFVFK